MLRRVINAATAVFHLKSTMSSSTLEMVWWTLRRRSAVAFSETSAGAYLAVPSFHTSSMNRREPAMPRLSHGPPFCHSKANMRWVRTVSAPNWSTSSSGLTTLPLDLDMRWMSR